MEEGGVLGFFKKTLTNVKKTFESTFNQPKEHKRALTRPRSKVTGRTTPLLTNAFSTNNKPRLDYESPKVEAP